MVDPVTVVSVRPDLLLLLLLVPPLNNRRPLGSVVHRATTATLWLFSNDSGNL